MLCRKTSFSVCNLQNHNPPQWLAQELFEHGEGQDRRRSAEDRLYLRQETGSGTTGEGKFSLLHPGFVGRKEKAGRGQVKVEMGEFRLWPSSEGFVICLVLVANTGRWQETLLCHKFCTLVKLKKIKSMRNMHFMTALHGIRGLAMEIFIFREPKQD